ncbi:flagellar motor protein MotB [Sulfitobacter guttiformis]|uniref:Chemotaxis protein MotB n=1 Tax=Sulfitobacter guttiformis TaxID=74349 RepID=A0A420DS66_9RHOB|nr:flagellar motor protein MotB [Sulfitobacter guttiformis]KIN74592.1 Chemotaxis protein MotB [Sulfitobacter guttiformis KCTC 32187]RKE97171.1 chemotaxis protein MotB [Sulfitobacter guttiformis]
MTAQANVAPVIIKRKKVIKGGGHHGGAWKVAYADFVTAMMAFFMLMWLLNATTEKQKQGLADYFAPTIPILQASGGGNGAFGGDSIFSEETLTKNGTGASVVRVAAEDKARGAIAEDTDSQNTAFESLNELLQGFGGESLVMENALEHIVTRITDEGMVIEIFSWAELQIFEDGSATPTQLMRDIVVLISEISKTVQNDIAIGGHVRTQPIVLKDNTVWDLSQQRATQVRLLMERNAIMAARIKRVTGHADRENAVHNPMDIRNDRIEIILLRDVS